MKKIKTGLLCTALCLFCLFALTGCQSDKARTLDIRLLEFNEKEISLGSGKEIYEIEALLSDLTEKELKSLNYRVAFEKKYAEYKVLEDRKVAEIEKLINELPAEKSVKLAHEEQINDANNAYNYATDAVKARISNVDTLNKAVAKMEQVKKDCWVECTVCGGDGKVICRLCNGRGSRKVNHTTPNGKTWLVSQDCKTTSSCGTCKGNGGTYVEK